MKKEIKDFLKELIDSGCISDNYIQKAQELLDEGLKEDVIGLWGYSFTDSYNSEDNRKIVKSGNKIEFVSYFKYSTSKNQFILENWDELDEIIKILQNYIKELENKEKENNDNE